MGEEKTAEQVVDELASEEDKWDAFEQVLGEMTPIYHEESEWLDIVRANISHAKIGGKTIGIQPDLAVEMDPEVSGPDVLRLLDDLCAHEVEHVNASNLEGKRAFAEQYPNFGKMAGHVWNIFEDEYIDMRRKRRFYGMRSKLAYYVWLHMNTKSRSPDIDAVEKNEGIANALIAGLLQVALAGYMNGEPSDEVKEAMARVEPLLDAVREEDSRKQRDVLCHAAMQVLLRYIPDVDDYDGDLMDDRKRATGGDPREGDDESPETPDGKPRVEMSDEMKDAVEEKLEDMMDDPDAPDPVPESDPEVVEDPDDAGADPDISDLEPEDIEMGEPEPDEESEGGGGDSDAPEPDDEGDEETASGEGEESEGEDSAEDVDGDESDSGGEEPDAGEDDGEAEDDGPGADEGPDIDDMMGDPLGEGDGGEDAGDGGGDSESESESPFDGHERDIEALIEEYGAENLQVS